jgi:flagellar hook-associated protein 2
MSTGAISSSTGSPISVTGLASGLDTKSIINALLEVEKRPIIHLTNQQEKVADQASALQTIKSSLLQLTFAVDEFKLPSLFEGVQTVTSSEPGRVSATITSGAGVGGYELEVTQLANSAQRTYSFAAPAAEDKITIGGREYTLKAGATAAELASKVNADGKGTVYAAVVNKETIVLSSRATGTGGLEAVSVTDPGGALTEKEGTAKEGKNAEYKLDGVAGTSSTNVLTGAIAGVSLTLESLTSAGPVTIAVQAPAVDVKTVETQLQSFVTLYNSTVEAIQKQLAERPVVAPTATSELATGTLFGDRDLTNLLNVMRQTMYEPIAGLAGEMASPSDVGISTGTAAGAGAATQSSLQGVLKLDPAKLASAVQANPEGAKLMLQQWSTKLNTAINNLAAPGATLESRINGDDTQVREMKQRISTMNEQLAIRQKALEQTYANLEGVMSRNSATGSWLSEQSAQLAANASASKK